MAVSPSASLAARGQRLAQPAFRGLPGLVRALVVAAHADLEGSHTGECAIHPEMQAVGVHLGIGPGEPEDLPQFLRDRAPVPEQRTGAERHGPQRRLDAANPELVPGPRHLPGTVREAPGPLGDLPEFKALARRRKLHEHEVQEERVPLVECEGEPHVPVGEFVGCPGNGIRRGRRRRVAGGPGEQHRRNQRRETGVGGGTADSRSVCGERLERPPGEMFMIGPSAHPAGHESAGGDVEGQGGRDRLERRLQPAQPAAGGRRPGSHAPGWRGYASVHPG